MAYAPSIGSREGHELVQYFSDRWSRTSIGARRQSRRESTRNAEMMARRIEDLANIPEPPDSAARFSLASLASNRDSVMTLEQRLGLNSLTRYSHHDPPPATQTTRTSSRPLPPRIDQSNRYDSFGRWAGGNRRSDARRSSSRYSPRTRNDSNESRGRSTSRFDPRRLSQRISSRLLHLSPRTSPPMYTMYNDNSDWDADWDDSASELSNIIEEWSMKPQVELMKERMAADHIYDGMLGVTWQNLTVKAHNPESAIHENFLSQFNIPRRIKEGRQKPPLKTILEDTHGCVKPGEMLLVLGRPGSGCTSLLKLLANRREGYQEITGDVKFGTLDHKQAKEYRGQIVMNTEEEIFYPSLTVGQTIDFATRMKTSHAKPSAYKSPEAFRKVIRDFFLRAVDIEHTVDTKVGDAFVRGVSGGERKRVSIIETLATRGSIFCWDNSTRGLDAGTALEYIKAVRSLTDIMQLTTIVTLYQAGNGIYELFDKVLVLDKGVQLYYGPQKNARPFMESLGFQCRPGSNVADFLTGVTVPTERVIRRGYEHRFPRSCTEIRDAYLRSTDHSIMKNEYDFPERKETEINTEKFKAAVASEKHPRLPKHSPLTSSFWVQIKGCVIRQYQILWGDKATFAIKQISTIVQALIAGSLFFEAASSSAGLFTKGGALFFSLLFNTLSAMSEVTAAFGGRPMLAKHRGFAFFHPAAYCIAQVTTDIPVLLTQVTVFSLILYFMTGLRQSAEAFFTYWIILFSAALCMTAAFRLIGSAFPSFLAASKASGFTVTAYLVYIGYMIHKPEMRPWFVWIFWIDPLSYAFSALLANEFYGVDIECVGPNLVPNGPGYSLGEPYQACGRIGGRTPGSTVITGDAYLRSFSYSRGLLWRNFAIIWVWWLFFFAMTVFFTTRRKEKDGGGVLVVPRERQRKIRFKLDEEANRSKLWPIPEGSALSEQNSTEKRTSIGKQLVKNTSIFTWKDLTYSVKTPSGKRTLLNNVQGWVKPGSLGALMGPSGAGKTTLLDVLAMRKTDGKIEGSIMVDGRPLPVSFQRRAGYCEQLDVHEPFTTVREALEFSALLRQGRETPDEEKLKYVDVIIDLLEMHDIENILIGTPGAGLNIEQRKRVTIGVELVAKPSILLFLDEPTSGLDGQAAFNTVRCLRKLADAGQAILVTIHQPSAQLFAQFDNLLLLAKGGHTVYFGDVGRDASTLKNYFRRNGAPCPADANPAEHMIDVVSGPLSKGKDWVEVWNESPESKQVVKELDRILSTESAKQAPAHHSDKNEFSMPILYQMRKVTSRMNLSLYRNTAYVNNKIMLHIITSLFNGFTFYKIGDNINDLQLTLFTIFNFIFVAPGVIAQLQPLFIQRRDVFETREKKSKTYHWAPFVTGLILSEIPYLIICAIIYFFCWYFTVDLVDRASRAGAIFFIMLLYEFVYTGIGQFVAAYAPNPVFAALVNPMIIGTLMSFCGVLVPYDQIQEFWRYWIYYLNPFNYIIGGMLTFALWDKPITCSDSEFAIFEPAPNTTCGDYLETYLRGFGSAANLYNPDATTACKVCEYTTGSDYLKTVNLNEYYFGWRDAAAVAVFSCSSYALVYLLMALRTKGTKTSS